MLTSREDPVILMISVALGTSGRAQAISNHTAG